MSDPLPEPCVDYKACKCLRAPCWYGYSMMFSFAWDEVTTRQQEAREMDPEDPELWHKCHSTEFFIARLRAAGLETMVSSDADNCYIRCGARMGRIMQEANRIGFRKRLKDEYAEPASGDAANDEDIQAVSVKSDSAPDRAKQSGFIDIDPGRATREDVAMAIHAPFSLAQKQLFANSLNDPTAFFSSGERQILTQSIIEASFLDTGAQIPLVKDVCLWGYAPGSPIMLHDYEERARLQRLWSFAYPLGVLVQREDHHRGVFFRKQPLHEIREYYGETITLYYAWMEHYINYLQYAAIIGGICWIVYVAGVLEVVYFYGLFIIAWATLFLEYWKRRESDLAFMWDVYKKEEVGREHPDFPEKSIRRNHPITGEEENWFDPSVRKNRMIISGLCTAFFLCIALGANFGAVFLGMNSLAQPFGNILSSIALVVTIEATKIVNAIIASKLTDWETQKKLREYAQSLGLKIVAFEFCVKFGSVFVVGFIKGYLNNPANDKGSGCNPPEEDNFCHKDLQIQIAVIFGTEMTVGQFTEVVVPLIKQRINAYMSEKAEAEALAKLRAERGEEEETEEQKAARKAEEDKEAASKAAEEERLKHADIEKFKVEGKNEMGLNESDAESRAIRMAELHLFRRQRAENLGLDGGECKIGDGDWITEDQENEAEKGDYWLDGGEREDYQEMCIQFGWIAIFSMGCMLSPVLAYLNNIVEIRTDSLGMDQNLRRPQYRFSNSLGVWYNILYFIAIVGITCNMLFYIKFNQVSDDPWFDSSEEYTLAMVIVGGEHFVILVKVFTEVLIPDESPWLVAALEGHDYLANKALGLVKDIDAEDVEADHVLPHVAQAQDDIKHHYSAYFTSEENAMIQIPPGMGASTAQIEKNADVGVGKVALTEEEEPPSAALGVAKTLEECPPKLQEMIQQSFIRYDLDDSGLIDAETELHQLCTNLAYSLQLDQGFEIIWAEVKVKGQDCSLDVPKFAEWFLSRFCWEHQEDKLVCTGVNDADV